MSDFYLGSVLIVRKLPFPVYKTSPALHTHPKSPNQPVFLRFLLQNGYAYKTGSQGRKRSRLHYPSAVLKLSTEIPPRFPGDASAYTREKVLLNSLRKAARRVGL